MADVKNFKLGNKAFQKGIRLSECPAHFSGRDVVDWVMGWATAADEYIVGLREGVGDKPDDTEKTYIQLIGDLVGERPAWLHTVSDRTAFSLLREGYRSRKQLEKAVFKGLELSKIPNLGKKEVKEIEYLLERFSPGKDKVEAINGRYLSSLSTEEKAYLEYFKREAQEGLGLVEISAAEQHIIMRIDRYWPRN